MSFFEKISLSLALASIVAAIHVIVLQYCYPENKNRRSFRFTFRAKNLYNFAIPWHKAVYGYTLIVLMSVVITIMDRYIAYYNYIIHPILEFCLFINIFLFCAILTTFYRDFPDWLKRCHANERMEQNR